MALFIEIYAFLSVVLRGCILTAQSLTVGGLAYLWLPGLPSPDAETERRLRLLLAASAGTLLVLDALAAASLLVMLSGTLKLSPMELLDVDAVRVDLIASLLAGAVALLMRRGGPDALRIAVACGVLLVAIEADATHAASRVELSLGLYLAECAHMLGAASWIGGIPYLLIALLRAPPETLGPIVRRFSAISIVSVAMLILAGLAMATDYLGDPSALYGSSYGVMLGAKIALLAGLLMLGGMNFLTGRKLRGDSSPRVSRLRFFAEVEIGVGVTALFCAASLASLPPASDMATSRATASEVIERIAPHWPPRLESPDHASLSTSAPLPIATEEPRAYALGEAPAPRRSAEDIAWSEYNHHWAGMFVCALGLLALAEKIHGSRPWRAIGRWPSSFWRRSCSFGPTRKCGRSAILDWSKACAIPRSRSTASSFC